MKPWQTQHALGANISVKDQRDINLIDVLRARGVMISTHPKKNITDLSMLPHEDQKQNGTCVGQAGGKGEEYREYKETGKVVRLSKRFIYLRSIAKDGNGNNSTVQGTSVRTMVTVLKDDGACRVELVPDNNDLSYPNYINFDVTTPEILTDASSKRIKGYAACLTLNDLKTAIDIEGIMNCAVIVGDWNSGSPLQPTPSEGGHAALIYGYEDAVNPKTKKSDTKIYDFNSWGEEWNEGGNGWFWWSEYEKYVYDMFVCTDMPDTIINYAKTQTYIFTRVMKYRMNGEDVLELQKRLSKEVALDGGMCYRYMENGQLYFSNYFGLNTQLAVQRYQAKHGIATSGTPETTGYGQVGNLTLKALNSAPATANSMIERWADAIQEHEGWYVGSHSYRNNNPGNLRYVGQTRAIDQDSGKFCIFKTYADGRQTLIDMLLLDCSGRSSIYKPTMTLLAYYEKYAPKDDGNDPVAYAHAIAAALGVTVDTTIGSFI